MERQLARSKWFASGWFAACGLAVAAGVEPPYLHRDDLENPQAIAAWLDKYAATANKRAAQIEFARGEAYQKRRYWSAASKAFGESALAFPTPAALVARTDNRLRGLAEIRVREKETTHARDDLAGALPVYRSALAAEGRLRMLSASALAQLQADEACLNAHLEANTASTWTPQTCRPLSLYTAPPQR